VLEQDDGLSEKAGDVLARRAAWDRFWNWALTDRFSTYYIDDARREFLGILNARAKHLGVGR
jgi:hypothetical protein